MAVSAITANMQSKWKDESTSSSSSSPSPPQPSIIVREMCVTLSPSAYRLVRDWVMLPCWLHNALWIAPTQLFLGFPIDRERGQMKPMDAEQLRENGHRMVDFIADYYKTIENFPVLSQVEVLLLPCISWYSNLSALHMYRLVEILYHFLGVSCFFNAARLFTRTASWLCSLWSWIFGPGSWRWKQTTFIPFSCLHREHDSLSCNWDLPLTLVLYCECE